MFYKQDFMHLVETVDFLTMNKSIQYNDGEMRVSNSEMSCLWSFTHFTNEYLTSISLKLTTIRWFDHLWDAALTEMQYKYILCILVENWDTGVM